MSMTAHSQRGVALLTILLLVVSITVVAGAMLASQKIAIRRSGLLFEQNQLLQDIDAGQQMAVTLIRADDTLNDTDSEQDIWAQPMPPYLLGGHSISIELRDEASRFNINNLYQNGEVNTVALALFERLLTQLGLESDIAIAVLDYQDLDTEVYLDGGDESLVYDQQRSGSSSGTLPNQPFVSVDQLQDLGAVSDEALATLRPCITAIPYSVTINVNTASPVLLAALIDGTQSTEMQALVEMRAEQVLTNISDLWQLPSLNTVSNEDRSALESLLAVHSQAFKALITATDSMKVGQARQRFATVLISKTDADVNGADSSDGSDNGDSIDDSGGSDNQAKNIKVVHQRLWVFRPSF